MSDTLTIPLTLEQNSVLSSLEQKMGCSREDIVSQHLLSLLEDLDDIAVAQDRMENGEFISHEEMKKEWGL